jgi:hypothetical protein
MAVGLPLKTTYADGDVFSASDINDTNGTINLIGADNYAAGKNKILNGDFGIWQRGTSFTAAEGYTADRWVGGSNATITFSRQTFTPGTAPVAGYEGSFFIRQAKSAGGTFTDIRQRIEDVRTFAGQTVTLSFWAKVDTGTASIEPYYVQNFGSGGSAGVASAVTAQTINTTWTRYFFTFTLPSISGKTIGTSNFLEIYATRCVTSSAVTIDTWGVQVEAGSVATAFQTATGTIQGELAACQRYYWRSQNTSVNAPHGVGIATATNYADVVIPFQVAMRVAPTFIETASLYVSDRVTYSVATTSVTLAQASSQGAILTCGVATGLTQFRTAILINASVTTGYVAFSAEL